jgi:tRNA(Ile2) C34 agmatinyltransferase TiaS
MADNPFCPICGAPLALVHLSGADYVYRCPECAKGLT